MPQVYNTPVKWGCPYDCGLCTDHEQHSCLTLVEAHRLSAICAAPFVTPEAVRSAPEHRSLALIEKMLDAVVRNEGKPDVVQISGGEPTLHPDFFTIIEHGASPAHPPFDGEHQRRSHRAGRGVCEAARGISMPDSRYICNSIPLSAKRSSNCAAPILRDVRQRALENLNKHESSTTLVVTLKKGLNDGEIGKDNRFRTTQPCVRGVTLQPIQDAGRLEKFDPATRSPDAHRSAPQNSRANKCLSRRRRDSRSVPSRFPGDGLRTENGRQSRPLTGLMDPQVLINGARNTIVYEEEPGVRDCLFKLFATNHSPESGAASLRDLLCCLPRIDAPPELSLSEYFPRADRPISRCSRFRRALGQENLHPHRSSRRPSHSLRHLQSFLSRRPGKNPSRSSPPRCDFHGFPGLPLHLFLLPRTWILDSEELA